jgi:hypothetical protein
MYSFLGRPQGEDRESGKVELGFTQLNISLKLNKFYVLSRNETPYDHATFLLKTCEKMIEHSEVHWTIFYSLLSVHSLLCTQCT